MTAITQRAKHFVAVRNERKETINAMVGMELAEVQEEQKKIILTFPIYTWELNPDEHTHGGILAAMLDIAMGCAAYSFSKAVFAPTIQMAVNFVKSTHADDVLRIEAICDHAGSRMAMIRALAYDQQGNVVASSNGSYAINIK